MEDLFISYLDLCVRHGASSSVIEAYHNRHVLEVGDSLTPCCPVLIDVKTEKPVAMDPSVTAVGFNGGLIEIINRGETLFTPSTSFEEFYTWFFGMSGLERSGVLADAQAWLDNPPAMW